VQEGDSQARAAIIISARSENVQEAIFTQLGRGVTVLEGYGGYTGDARPVLYVVLYRTQITLLKRVIASIDPGAFVVVSEVHEVLGEGFKPMVIAH
jgi:uncharacterized membrane-anchored protein YitT (DUF2179 family)